MPDSSHQNNGLIYCRSTAHRAVMQLLAIAEGCSPSPKLKEEIQQSSPKQMAEIANQNLVHCILHTAFTRYPELKEAAPRDLLLYFELMYSANLERNQEAKEELVTLGELFYKADIPAVVLKGGAEILAPYYRDPAHRYISDLDILIPEHKISQAAEILYARGGTSHPDDKGHYRNHHHIPAITGGSLPFSIELHKRIGDGITHEVLTGEEILERSIDSKVRGINIPTPQDRFTHFLLHTQVRSHLYARTLLNLRDCNDHLHFQKGLSNEVIEKVRRKFKRHGILTMIDGLDTLSECIFTQPRTHKNNEADIWAVTALRNFGRPKAQKYLDSLMWLKTYMHRFIAEPEKRRHYLRKLFSTKGWMQFFAFHKERLERFK